MKTIANIADGLEAQRDLGERIVFAIAHSDEILQVMDDLTWARGIKTVLKTHVVALFKEIDYEIDGQIAEMMAHAVRTVRPAEPNPDADYGP